MHEIWKEVLRSRLSSLTFRKRLIVFLMSYFIKSLSNLVYIPTLLLGLVAASIIALNRKSIEGANLPRNMLSLLLL